MIAQVTNIMVPQNQSPPPPQDQNPPLKRGIHPLHLFLLIACAALAFPILLYLLFIFTFMLMPGGFD
jgi:hypothetical protein